MYAPDDDHYWLVARRVLAGYVIPFLGAGANLAERPQHTPWQIGRYLPSGVELADELAQKSRFPDEAEDLLRVSQYVDAMLGERVLYQYLHAVFDADYPCNSLHDLLAWTAEVLRATGARHQLVLTTNYDDALERAFNERGVDYDLVWYEAKRGERRGMFIHQAPDGQPVPIKLPNEYDALSLDDRTIILKLHGAINRRDKNLDSFVITENNYIDYLSRGDIAGRLPVTVREAMTECHFLFLGYSMRDWNLRVILNRMWGEAPLDVKSWAVQTGCNRPALNAIERKLWADRGEVELFQVPLKDYVAKLATQLHEAGP
jgi:hypothetical protein